MTNLVKENSSGIVSKESAEYCVLKDKVEVKFNIEKVQLLGLSVRSACHTCGNFISFNSVCQRRKSSTGFHI